MRFILLPGRRFDTVGVAPLIDGVCFGGLIADKAFGSNTVIADLNERGDRILFHGTYLGFSPCRSTRNSTSGAISENFLCKLKEFKRIGMRADKTDRSFAAFINLAATVIDSR